MLKLLHTADVHLDARFPGLGPLDRRRRDDFNQTFCRLVDLALQQRVDLFLVAGDLFDSQQPSAEVIALVQAELQRLVDRAVLPVLLPGTHDGLYGGGLYAETRFPGCVLLDGRQGDGPFSLTLSGGEVHLYGRPYLGGDPAGSLQQMRRRDLPGLHLGLLHGSLQGSPEWDYRAKDLPFTREDLIGWDLDYVALGHYHRLQQVEEQGRVFGAYPGSPEGKRFGEEGERYALLVEIDHKQAQVTPQAVQRRRLESRQLDISSLDGSEELLETIAGMADEDLLLRLTLTGSSGEPLDPAGLKGRLDDRFYYLEIEDRSCFLDSSLADRLAGEETIRGRCVRRFRELLAQHPDQRETIDLALREVLVRFQTQGGGRS